MSAIKPFLPDSFATKFAELQRRIKTLEVSPRAPFTSLTDPTGVVAGSVDIASHLFGIQAASVATGESTSSAGWVDLTTPGPSLNVNVGSTGRVLLIVSVAQVSTTAAGGAGAAHVGIAVDGASPTTTDDGWVAIGGGASSEQVGAPITYADLKTGLSPGVHTFKLQYENQGFSSTFVNRTLIAIPL